MSPPFLPSLFTKKENYNTDSWRHFLKHKVKKEKWVYKYYLLKKMNINSENRKVFKVFFLK